ncbi:uncharacterized protein LOC9645854 [Selaginella moellendorffii]|nr:uncharacterized protein LOC9645854 [Selaginella moellendorffii]|eukprot:XP_002976155.2 uncharacterized protein LOC9645854 [Selaginella moellendorffii]
MARSKAPRAFVLRRHLLCAAAAMALLVVWAMWMSKENEEAGSGHTRYLYWGSRIDCPGKMCEACGGLGHQESSLRCALEEAIHLNRTFVLPSTICIVGKHNDRMLPGTSSSWDSRECAVEALYDLDLMSSTGIRVITDSSREWISSLRAARSVEHALVNVHGLTRQEISQSPLHSHALIINRTANSLAWFVECKDRKNRSAVMLPYAYLPTMAAKQLREAAEKIQQRLGDYDAMHVRRGDVLKVRKDGQGEKKTKFPHLDRDTQPEAILRRISAWVPRGRTLYVASNERKPGFFDPLGSRYKIASSSNFSDILGPVIHNNYQLFIVDRLVLSGAKTVIQTFKENPGDLSLTDDEKKVLRWQKPVYTFD